MLLSSGENLNLERGCTNQTSTSVVDVGRESYSKRHLLTSDIIDEKNILEDIENDRNDKRTLINFMRFKVAAAF
jgi:hypothetical protein